MSKNSSSMQRPQVAEVEIEVVESSPVRVSRLPDGVQVHDAGVSPYATRTPRVVHDPKRPPAGWMGSYSTCGGCGDFLPTSTCARCACIPTDR